MEDQRGGIHEFSVRVMSSRRGQRVRAGSRQMHEHWTLPADAKVPVIQGQYPIRMQARHRQASRREYVEKPTECGPDDKPSKVIANSPVAVG